MLKTNFLKTLQKGYDKILPWNDYLRFKIEWNNFELNLINYFENILNNIDFDNSNFSHDRIKGYDLTFHKVSLKTWPAIIVLLSYRNIPIPIMCYNEYHEHNKKTLKSFWKFDFYWSYFRLREVWYISDEFHDYYISFFDNSLITRLDFKIDFFTNDENKKLFKYKQVIKPRKNSVIETHTKDTFVNSWRVGSPSSKRVLVRWYDKLMDTNKKWKMLLYSDFYEYQVVHRLEFEFLNHFTKPYKWISLQFLQDKISDYVGGDLTTNIFYTYDKMDLSDAEDRLHYIKTTKWYLKNLATNKVDLYRIVTNVYLEIWLSVDEIDALIDKNKLW